MAQAQAGAPNKFSIDHILQKTTANDDAQRGNPIDDEHHDDNLNYLITMATTAPVATTPLTSEDAIATPGNSGDGAVRTDGAAVTTPQPSTSKGEDSRKRPRTAFSVEQVRVLEQEFQRNKYLSMGKRVDISKQLGLTEQQIKIWFQNRRTKWKRKFTNNFEMFPQAPVMWRPSFLYPGVFKYGLLTTPTLPPGPLTAPGNNCSNLMMNRIQTMSMMSQRLRMLQQNPQNDQ